MPVNPLAQFRQTYFEECAGLLEEMQAGLETLASGTADDETLHAVFRCVHSIKGGAGAFGYEALVAFSHLLESLLDELRDHRIPPSRDVVQVLLHAGDALADIVAAARDDTVLPEDFASDVTLALRALLERPRDTPASPQGAAPRHAAETQQPGERHRYRIVFAPRTELLERANEPLLLI